MYCKKCGFQLTGDAAFCPNCGTKVEMNGVGDIEQKAVFGGIDDNEDVDSRFIQNKATWIGEDRLNQIDLKYERNKQTLYKYRKLIESQLNVLYEEKEKSDSRGGCIVPFIGMILMAIGLILGDNWIWLAVVGMWGPLIYIVLNIKSEDKKENRIHNIERKIEIYKKAYSDLLKVTFNCEDYESKIINIYNESVNKASIID